MRGILVLMRGFGICLWDVLGVFLDAADMRAGGGCYSDSCERW